MIRVSAEAPGTRIFVKNHIDSSAQLMHVTLNDVKIAELGAFEVKSADTPIGESTLRAQYFGLIASPSKGLLRKFSMKQNQKRFFITKYEYVFAVGGTRLVLVEIPQEEFFRF